MLRAFRRACLLLPLASFAAAVPANVEEQDVKAAIRLLDTGDWETRIRTVHQLEYMQEDGIPALAVAAVDGDWQVRMAAVHALGPQSPKTTPLLKAILKNEPCPVVRLVALHNLGSQAADGAEEQAIDWMFSASSAQINACRDQPAPGRAPWAANVPSLPTSAATAVAAALPFVRRRAVPKKPAPELPESHEVVVTADVPKAAVPPAPPPAEPAGPTKNQRYAELDAILAEPAGREETLGDAAAIARRSGSPSAAVPPGPAAARPNEIAALAAPRRAGVPEDLPRPVVTTPAPESAIGAPAKFEAGGIAAPPGAAVAPVRRKGAAESLPRPVVTSAAPERAVEAPAEFEAAGSKARHDAVPDLIAALKNADAATRSRAADELGYSGAAAAPAVPALMSALRDKSPRVRASASLALGNIGAADAAVVPLLVKALKDKNLDVRYAATLALSRIPTPAGRRAFQEHIGEDARRAIEQRQGPDPVAD